MTPTNFPESNRTLVKPANLTEEECGSLPIFTDGQICVSCWELSEEEKQKILKTGKIWLMVWSGTTQPPVCITAESPIITNETEEK
jgi:hypothetical protein